MRHQYEMIFNSIPSSTKWLCAMYIVDIRELSTEPCGTPKQQVLKIVLLRLPELMKLMYFIHSWL